MEKTGKNYGFTLAEVLITLVVIGVIAAMTVPAVINSVNKKDYVTGLQKSYSTLANAIRLSQAENGEVATWNFEKETESPGYVAEKYILPYLNVVKVCGYAANQGCFSPDMLSHFSGTPWFHRDDDTGSYKFILSDGTVVSIQVIPNCIAEKMNCLSFHVDVNGHKGPNQLGRDFYGMNLLPFTNELILYGTKSVTEYDETTGKWAEISKAEIDTSCENDGWYCGAKIRNEGWEMNY